MFWIVIGWVALYVLLDVVAQLLPPHYSPIRDPESDLAVGPFGYIMGVNFLNRGALSLAFLYGLSKTTAVAGGFGTPKAKGRFRIGIFAFGVWAVGALLLAFFPTDVPATPISWHGVIHLVVAILAFVGGAVGAVVLSLQFGWNEALRKAKAWALLIAVLTVALLFVLLGSASSPVGGLTERLFLGSVLLWVVVVSAYMAKRPEPTGSTREA